VIGCSLPSLETLEAFVPGDGGLSLDFSRQLGQGRLDSGDATTER
jgi:hypothetical protein